MDYMTRRTLLKAGTAAGAAAALTGPALLDWAKAWAQNAPWKPEKGAKLSMLRWKYFVQSEDDAFVKLIAAFTKATGVPVEISRNKWICVPVCYSGALMNYRVEASKKAGFSKFPDKLDAFLEYTKAMKAQGTPGGFALGHASGDANSWAHWCLWSNGGETVDKNDKVIINSPGTAKALEYAKALYGNMIPGTAAWNDSSNNKAFLAGDIHWTNNGISIYVAAKKNAKQIAEDMNHAYFPVGVSGKPTELHLMYPVLAMTYTKYPQACKALMAFMLEADNFNPWIEAAQGYLTHCLNAYDKNPVWTADPKTTPFRDVAKRTRTAGGLGSVGEKAATAISDFVVVDMFANYCTGREDVKGAIANAERQLKRIYRG
jgi:multiple sugar transport system substrate-binding protein